MSEVIHTHGSHEGHSGIFLWRHRASFIPVWLVMASQRFFACWSSRGPERRVRQQRRFIWARHASGIRSRSAL